MDRECVSGDGAFFGSVEKDGEAVGGWFGSNSLAWEVASEEVADEGGFSDGVLAYEHYLWFRWICKNDGLLVE